MWKRIVAILGIVILLGVADITTTEKPYEFEKGIEKDAVGKGHPEGLNLTELEKQKQVEKEKQDRVIREWMQGMTIDQKLAQCMILTNEKDMTAWNLGTYEPGGVIFFGVDFNHKTIAEVAQRVDSLQKCVDMPLFVGVDEEGGEISRVKGLSDEDVPVFESARELNKKGKDIVVIDTRQKVTLLQQLGINLNYEPVADVVTDKGAYMYQRSAGGDAKEVARYVEQVVSVMRGNKMGSCLKHFPGYGNNGNTHAVSVTDKRSLQTYREKDFLPFETGIAAGADMVMVSHITMQAVDDKNPASLSPAVHQLLRDELHFEGVVIADDLNMQAIRKRMTIEEATGKAFEAGNDMVFSADFAASMRGARAALQEGRITEEEIDASVMRILRCKLQLGLR